LRGADRYVARLVHQKVTTPSQEATIEDQPVRLEITTRGVLDNLTILPAMRRQPGEGEVEIRVHASGLNFRDVLKALGVYPGEPGPFGDECAGEVVAVGAGVDRFKVGDRVYGTTPGAFATYVTARADFLAHMPPRLSYEEAATVPIVFLTAYYALHELAHIQPGERILIHAAAGGVGMAAVQLAKRTGAVIFGTAGSPEKRAYLKSIGVDHVMDSRSLAFAEEIMTITQGEGVDIVLNSLNGDFIPKNLAVLKEQGRFLEIGKIGVWSAQEVAAVKPGVQYHLIFLGEQMAQEPQLVNAMLLRLTAELEQGTLHPLPQRLFALAEAGQAFRFMAQAKHIGKIVVTQPRAATPVTAIQADATYLITGGLGGLGLVTAQWLIAQGARHLMLVGRTGAASQQAQATLAQWEAEGVQVTVAQADVSQLDEVSGVLAQIEASMPPLRGIIHAAGVIDDGMLHQQSWARFEQVMAPKVRGAWNLHRLTQDIPLDFFVLYSAGAVLLGSLGQGNYVAANTFLDMLAHHRRALGLPALSINWGPWAEVGMAAALSDRDQQRFARMGVGSMTPAEGSAALQTLLASPAIRVGVLPIRWATYLAAQEREFPFFAELQQQVEAQAQSKQATLAEPAFLQRLAATHPSKQRGVIMNFISDSTRSVLQMSSSRPLNVQQPLSELGLDSLMALELRNVLSRGINQELPATLLFDHPTIAALADYLGRAILSLLPDAPTEESKDEQKDARKAEPAKSANYEQSLAEVAEMSDDEAEALLLAELDGNN
jgi:NADPH:quinone reductase-like Zn-dependent oxidoreductase